METTLGCAAAPSCVTEKTGDVILLGAAKLLHEDSQGETLAGPRSIAALWRWHTHEVAMNRDPAGASA
jgi:hypothetical protein